MYVDAAEQVEPAVVKIQRMLRKIDHFISRAPPVATLKVFWSGR